VSQHQRRQEKEEVSPPPPAAVVVACPVTPAETPARPTSSKISTPELALSHKKKSIINFAAIPSEPDSNGKEKQLNVTEQVTLTSEIWMPQSLSFNNKSIINFDTIPSENFNTGNAFKYNSKNGKERSDSAKRKAKSRASNFLVDAIQNCGDNPNDRTAALAAALAHTDIQGITKNVAIIDPETSEMMRKALNQQRRIIERATEKENTRGRCGDKKRSFVESVFVSMAASPDQNSGKNKKALIEAMGIPVSTGYRLMANAEEKRRQLSENIDSVSWSNVQSQKGYSKV
jgi:hypothetical protein